MFDRDSLTVNQQPTQTQEGGDLLVKGQPNARVLLALDPTSAGRDEQLFARLG